MAGGSGKSCVHETVLEGRPLRIHEVTAMAMVANVPTRIPVQCFYEWEAPDWPLSRIRRRGWLRRLFSQPSGLLLEDETFNQWFRVEAADEDFTIALLGPDMQKFLLTKTSVEWTLGEGAIKLFYSGAFRRNRMEGGLERLRAMWALVPEEIRSY